MNDADALARCVTYINCQLTPPPVKSTRRETAAAKLAITLSRATGSGALRIAEQLAVLLDEKTGPKECAWTVFDRNLVEHVLEEHHLPRRLAEFMPEDRISQVQDMVEEILGLHPPTWTLQHQITETILHLAELGNVIIVGRGAHIITRKLPHVFHARLIASMDTRIARVQKQHRVSAEAAREMIRRSDRARARYLKRYFKQEIDDPLRYDLVINTDRVSVELAAELIGSAALRHVGAG